MKITRLEGEVGARKLVWEGGVLSVHGVSYDEVNQVVSLLDGKEPQQTTLKFNDTDKAAAKGQQAKVEKPKEQEQAKVEAAYREEVSKSAAKSAAAAKAEAPKETQVEPAVEKPKLEPEAADGESKLSLVDQLKNVTKLSDAIRVMRSHGFSDKEIVVKAVALRAEVPIFERATGDLGERVTRVLQAIQ